MKQQGRPIRRRLVPLAAFAGLALALSGCLRMHIDVTVTEDEKINGTAILAFADSVAALMGGELESAFDDTGFENDEGVTVEDYKADGYTGRQYTFESTPLADFNDEDMSITREGDDFVLNGRLDMSGVGEEDAEAVPGLEGLADTFDIVLTFTFPGEVTSANGTIEGDTVTWTPVLGEENPLEARAKATPGSDLPIGVILGIVGAVLVAGVVVLLVVLNRRKPSAAPAVPVGEGAAPVEAMPGDLAAPAVDFPASVAQTPPAVADAAPVAETPAAVSDEVPPADPAPNAPTQE